MVTTDKAKTPDGDSNGAVDSAYRHIRGAIIRGEQGVYAEAVKAAGLMRPQ